MSSYKGQVAITIQSPIDSVYAYLADFTKHPEWAKNLSKVTQITPGAMQAGTVFKTQEGVPPVTFWQQINMMLPFMQGLLSGAKLYSEATITALEPPCRIGWKAGIPKGDGFFNLAGGIAMLVASVLAGVLWDQLGPSFTFYAGAVFCTVTIAGIAISAVGRPSRSTV